jgi:wyosine [tRNA(Phe)-imidazoG37] synthetase (radical SAM superfamily)
MTSENYLTVSDHNRDVSGHKYIYPVVSRRAGGLSIGINLNTNNACNWHCLYCQVPNLIRGVPPPIDLKVLEQELRSFLTEVLHGDFMTRHVAAGDRHLKDIAFSGNGEPTSAKEFPLAVLLVEKILQDFNLLSSANPIKLRLITNGSLLHKPEVIQSLRVLARCNGEVWFKLDAATKEGIERINAVHLNPQKHLQGLKNCAAVCPTFIQTCLFAVDNQPPQANEIASYIALVSQVKSFIQGVHLYGLARPSMQDGADRLSQLPVAFLDDLADKLRQQGIVVHVSA